MRLNCMYNQTQEGPLIYVCSKLMRDLIVWWKRERRKGRERNLFARSGERANQNNCPDYSIIECEHVLAEREKKRSNKRSLCNLNKNSSVCVVLECSSVDVCCEWLACLVTNYPSARFSTRQHERIIME